MELLSILIQGRLAEEQVTGDNQEPTMVILRRLLDIQVEMLNRIYESGYMMYKSGIQKLEKCI